MYTIQYTYNVLYQGEAKYHIDETIDFINWDTFLGTIYIPIINTDGVMGAYNQAILDYHTCIYIFISYKRLEYQWFTDSDAIRI